MKNQFYVIAISLLLTGCFNDFERYYMDMSTGPHIDKSSLIRTTDEPEFERSTFDKREADEDRMGEEGYVMIGQSHFLAADGNTIASLTAHAKKVGATKVIGYKKYKSSEQTQGYITRPTMTTSNERGRVDVGNTYGTYMSTTTTTSREKDYFTTAYHQFEYAATYWLKRKTGPFGARLREPTPQERTKAGTNKGVIVDLTVKGGPAFKADIVPGDLLVSVNGDEIWEVDTLLAEIQKNKGQVVELEILRNGKTVQKKLRLNQ